MYWYELPYCIKSSFSHRTQGDHSQENDSNQVIHDWIAYCHASPSYSPIHQMQGQHHAKEVHIYISAPVICHIIRDKKRGGLLAVSAFSKWRLNVFIVDKVMINSIGSIISTDYADCDNHIAESNISSSKGRWRRRGNCEDLAEFLPKRAFSDDWPATASATGPQLHQRAHQFSICCLLLDDVLYVLTNDMIYSMYQSHHFHLVL